MKPLLSILFAAGIALAQLPPMPPSSPPAVPTFNPNDIAYTQNITNVVGGVTNVTNIQVIETY